MSNYTDADRSIGTIIKDLTADLSMLLRSEIALLKLELKESAAKLGGGAAMMGAALFLGLIGLAFLFVTITLGMVALGLPPWLSSLIVTVVLFAAAGILVVMGKKKLQGVNFVPSESIEHIKTDIDTLKADVARARSR
ncbi:MAG TPA: phage holin family protein [Thermoanaerobaculia bacterium]|nr:phage holin family protein [Thermoanaerobaculia bacterium]